MCRQKIPKDDNGFILDTGCQYVTALLRYKGEIPIDRYAQCKSCPLCECLEYRDGTNIRWRYVAKLVGIKSRRLERWYFNSERGLVGSPSMYSQIPMAGILDSGGEI
jgi:hypothetical protein